MRRWCSRATRTILPIPRSRSCSLTRPTTPRARVCCSAGVHARQRKTPRGPSTCSPSTAGWAARSNGKPIARDSSGADDRWPTRRRSRAGRSRERPARSSIPWPACASGCGSPPAPSFASRSRRESRRIEPRRWRSSASTATRARWSGWLDKPGGMFLLRSDGMPQADRHLLSAVARIVLRGDLGDLGPQLDRKAPWLSSADIVPASAVLRSPKPASTPVPIEPRVMDNGVGGFTAGGREDGICRHGERQTPLPWSNVLANPEFGTVVSESGAAYTWAGNSRENRLTPFANDPISDPTGEAIFLRDEDDMTVWGATPGTLVRTADSGRWGIRHGAGGTHFEYALEGLEQSLAVCVAPDDPVKLSLLTLTNTSSRTRRLSVFGYVDWVLGPPRSGDRRL